MIKGQYTKLGVQRKVGVGGAPRNLWHRPQEKCKRKVGAETSTVNMIPQVFQRQSIVIFTII